MKAIVRRRSGGPKGLALEDVPRPEPAPREVLVRVRAAALNPADNHVLRAPGFVRWFARSMALRHGIPGADMAGVVEAVGQGVDQWSAGDEVFADLSSSGWGAFAEYAVVPQEVLGRKPSAVTFDQAAAAPMAGVTALQALRDTARLRVGEHVAVNGASGGVGTFAVQVAKALGAKVTAVCSGRNVEWVTRLGADAVVDYEEEDFTRADSRYDVILDTAAHRPIKQYLPAIRDGGAYVLVGGQGRAWMQASMGSRKRARPGRPRVLTVSAHPDATDLDCIGDWIQQGAIRPVVQSTCPLSGVPQALVRLHQGHAQGKTVVRVE